MCCRERLVGNRSDPSSQIFDEFRRLWSPGTTCFDGELLLLLLILLLRTFICRCTFYEVSASVYTLAASVSNVASTWTYVGCGNLVVSATGS